jgi:hypothetical protein
MRVVKGVAMCAPSPAAAGNSFFGTPTLPLKLKHTKEDGWSGEVGRNQVLINVFKFLSPLDFDCAKRICKRAYLISKLHDVWIENYHRAGMDFSLPRNALNIQEIFYQKAIGYIHILNYLTEQLKSGGQLQKNLQSCNLDEVPMSLCDEIAKDYYRNRQMYQNLVFIFKLISSVSKGTMLNLWIGKEGYIISNEDYEKHPQKNEFRPFFLNWDSSEALKNAPQSLEFEKVDFTSHADPLRKPNNADSPILHLELFISSNQGNQIPVGNCDRLKLICCFLNQLMMRKDSLKIKLDTLTELFIKFFIASKVQSKFPINAHPVIPQASFGLFVWHSFTSSLNNCTVM